MDRNEEKRKMKLVCVSTSEGVIISGEELWVDGWLDGSDGG